MFVHQKFSFIEVDIESNPGPRKSSALKIWNLNGLAAYEFTNLFLLEGYIKFKDIEIICLLETFLDSAIPIDDNWLSIPGYSMMRADHPSNTERGGVCLYHKEYLSIIQRDDTSNLKEWLVTEINVKNERYFLTCLYRSPSRNREQFQSFCDSLDILMNNINSLNSAISILLEISMENNSDNIGRELYTITSTTDYRQNFDKPTHFTNNYLLELTLFLHLNLTLLWIQELKSLSVAVVIMISYMKKLTLESLFLH